jgi:hypothetical protein
MDTYECWNCGIDVSILISYCPDCRADRWDRPLVDIDINHPPYTINLDALRDIALTPSEILTGITSQGLILGVGPANTNTNYVTTTIVPTIPDNLDLPF